MAMNYKLYGKLKAQPTTVDGIYFPSQHEADVYQAIRLCVPPSRILCHQAIPLLPRTPEFLEMDWDIDFIILSPDLNKRLYIEAKGIKTEEFMLKLRVVHYIRPETTHNLLIVTPQAGMKFGRIIKSHSIMQMVQMLGVLEASEWLLKPRH